MILTVLEETFFVRYKFSLTVRNVTSECSIVSVKEIILLSWFHNCSLCAGEVLESSE